MRLAANRHLKNERPANNRAPAKCFSSTSRRLTVGAHYWNHDENTNFRSPCNSEISNLVVAYSVLDDCAQPIRGEIVGSEYCEAEGIRVRSPAPVLELCRQLIAAGYDPGRPLLAYRADTLCLKVRAIGEAAGLEVNSKGTGFAPYRGVRTASPVRANQLAAVEGRAVTRCARRRSAHRWGSR